MRIKQRVFFRNTIRKIKSRVVDVCYKIISPFSRLLERIITIRDKRVKEKITKEQAAKWFANSIVKYKVRYPKAVFSLVIAEGLNEYQHYSDIWCISDVTFLPLLKKDKHIKAFYKFNEDIDFQEMVVDVLKSKRGVIVTEIKEDFSSTLRPSRNYHKAYFINLEE